MITLKNYRLGFETLAEQMSAGRYNPTRVATFRNRAGIKRVRLDAGTSDNLFFFREHDLTVCLCVSYRYGYFGCQAWNTTGAETLSIFFQTPEDCEDLKGWEDSAPINLAKYCLRWLQ